MNTYEFEVTVIIMMEGDSKENAHAAVEDWLSDNVFDYGAIVEVS